MTNELCTPHRHRLAHSPVPRPPSPSSNPIQWLAETSRRRPRIPTTCLGLCLQGSPIWVTQSTEEQKKWLLRGCEIFAPAFAQRFCLPLPWFFTIFAPFYSMALLSTCSNFCWSHRGPYIQFLSSSFQAITRKGRNFTEEFPSS